MATAPIPSPSEHAQTRAAMLTVYGHWKPAKTPQEQAGLAAEVAKTLSVYGYGALPSDPLQAKAKISGFAEVLEECPVWAVEKAGRDWRKKEKEPPTPSAWLARARKEMGYFDPYEAGGRSEFGHPNLNAGRAYELLVDWLRTHG